MNTEQATIEQMNEAIATFLGGKVMDDLTVQNYTEIGIPKSHVHMHDFDTLRVGGYEYHTSWDWLMPVVEKIETLEKGRFSVAIDRNYTTISDDTRKPHQREIVWIHKLPNNENNRLSRTYQAVYQFIQWYNNQTTSNE